MQDSNYTITKEIYNEIGGDPVEHFDSTYSIALAILKKMKGGGSCKLQEATLAAWENHKKYEINPEAGFDGISKAFVDVNVPEPVLEENKTLDITNNGSYTMTPSQDFDAIKMGTIHVNVPTGGASFDWDGTGYTPTNSNQIDQADEARKQEAIDYTKQKFAEWDPSRTSADSLYSRDKKLVYAPNIDLKNVTNTHYMFLSCKSLTTLPDGFNCPLSTNTSYMFQECTLLTTIPDGFSCPETTNTNGMFSDCNSLTALPDGFNCPLSTNTSYMFNNCKSLKSLPKLDFGKTTNIGYFFGFSTINTLTDLGGFTGLKIDWNDNNGLAKCPNLTKQSVLNVINELVDVKALGETHTIKFHPNSLALLSDEEKAIATNKGWILA